MSRDATIAVQPEPVTLPRKPLYLIGREALEVRAEDGSLAVFRARVPAGRFPIRRVSRIVATSRVHWRGEAFALCFEHGIPVVIIDAAGGVRGVCTPACRRLSPFSELLDELTAESHWRIGYESILRHLRSRELRVWEQERAASNPLAPAERSAWIRCYVQRAEPPVSPTFDCRGAVRAIVERQLHRASARGQYWAIGGEILDLAGDLTAILYGRLLMRAGGLFARLDGRGAVHMFESDAFDLAPQATRLLGSLLRGLLRRADRWH